MAADAPTGTDLPSPVGQVTHRFEGDSPVRGDETDRQRRSVRLTVVRALHSAVFLVELSAILWLLVTGITGRRDRTVVVAGCLVAAEAAVFVTNRGVCPLTPLAERLGARRGSVSDIFLPSPIARTIPIWSSALVGLGVVLHIRRLLRERHRAV